MIRLPTTAIGVTGVTGILTTMGTIMEGSITVDLAMEGSTIMEDSISEGSIMEDSTIMNLAVIMAIMVGTIMVIMDTTSDLNDFVFDKSR